MAKNRPNQHVYCVVYYPGTPNEYFSKVYSTKSGAKSAAAYHARYRAQRDPNYVAPIILEGGISWVEIS